MFGIGLVKSVNIYNHLTCYTCKKSKMSKSFHHLSYVNAFNKYSFCDLNMPNLINKDLLHLDLFYYHNNFNKINTSSLSSSTYCASYKAVYKYVEKEISNLPLSLGFGVVISLTHSLLCQIKPNFQGDKPKQIAIV